MNGCVIPGTSIAVDFWQAHKHPGIRLFFLTHLHGDHVVGLTSTWQRPIYCSPLTAQLLKERHGIGHSFLRPLEEGQTHIVGYCHSRCVQAHGQVTSSSMKQLSRPETSETVKTKDRSCDSISVTVINANHCPGAVMFLFEGSFGKILHTGDFRFHPSMLEEDSLLFKHIGSIDRLYLDNTYCSPKCVFPSRQEALEEIVNIAERHRDHDVVFGTRALGKEQLLAAVALALGEMVNVSVLTFSVVSALGFPNVFQTGRPDLRLRVVPFHQVSSDFVRRLNAKKPTIVILPTALYQGICGEPYARQQNVFVVPYSDHSSYPELVEFVSKLKPACVVPIVCGKVRGPFGVDVSCREDMSCFQPYLSKTRSSRPAALVGSSADTPNPLCLHTGSLFSDEQNHLCPKTAGFDDLFPDLQGPLSSKRKRPSWKRPRKRLHPLGITYLSEDEDTETGAEQVSTKAVGRSSDMKRNAAGEQNPEMTDSTTPGTDSATHVWNHKEKVDANDQDDVIWVDSSHENIEAMMLNKRTQQQTESCVRNKTAVFAKIMAPVANKDIASEGKLSSCVGDTDRHQSTSQAVAPDSMDRPVDKSATELKHSPSSLRTGGVKPKDAISSNNIREKRLWGDHPSADVPALVHMEASTSSHYLPTGSTAAMCVAPCRTESPLPEGAAASGKFTSKSSSRSRKCCICTSVREYLAYRYSRSASEMGVLRHAKLLHTANNVLGPPGMRKLCKQQNVGMCTRVSICVCEGACSQSDACV